ncbi:SusC/RagA family TonB-linked outer membrane protein [Chitinophaga sp. SYP-B3965]|uniref:SusC/RagA family TonB-linked outer membrane protein n=1 Tax=Chitinophaga sp. SYP-B3965 TaxID=2663120 RepID=UPI0012998EDA|nr:TonB-dependent receptor [Chitinophaga sp. SYP-B3965]MRG47821.1 SusC/RagA family TonB-linked outer membrane protein [Chitinophaga sp. SYP-B3965]
MLKKLLLFNFLLLLLLRVQYAAAESVNSPVTAFADHEIKGIVKDSLGTPLPGVTLMVKNKFSIGTTTDVNGRYILVVPDNAVIIVRMIGFQEQEISADGRTTIDIIMKSSASNLNETVVVAYGTQKKREVVGSVTSINVEDLKVPSSNLTTALAGRAAGLIAFQRSGEPGADNANFFIRGVTTFGYKQDPLILIDGVELTTDDLARLRPDDIESFSIMKDATSTALYGARGANGVILVTTKRGKQGPAKVNLRVENSVTAPTKKIELADPITYMKLANEATLTRNRLEPILYTEEKIERTASGENPYVYPANDWDDMLFRKYATSQRANLNVSGGGTVARYFISGSYTKDNGMLKVDKRNNFNNNVNIGRYTFRANVDVDLTKTTTLTVRASGNYDDYKGPLGSGATSGGALMYSMAMHSNPVMFPAYYEKDADHWYVKHIMFGNAGQGGSYINPYALMVMGYKDESRSFMSAQTELKQNFDFLIPGLNFRTMLNVNRTSNFSILRAYNPFYYNATGYDRQTKNFTLVPLNPDQGTEYLEAYGGGGSGNRINAIFYWENALNYGKTIGDHSINAMLIGIMRSTIAPPSAAPNNQSTLQLSLPYRNSGVSGRLTYNYASKYFAEFNFGYNGSERFYEKQRFGFFPSAGVAWTISNEDFFKPYSKSVTNLKLRGTYGLVGNDAIGNQEDRFFYLSQTNPNDASKGATFGRDNGYTRPGYSITRYANQDITWEKSYQSNIALELGLFNKFTFTGEYYTTQRKNILMDRSNNPSTMGLADTTRANMGSASSRGVDLSLNYSANFTSDTWLEVMGNFTYATGRFKVVEEPTFLPNEAAYRTRVGYPVNQQWGYIAERLFVDDEEARNSPRQNFGPYGGGDIKYTDVNRDGEITTADRVPIGYPTNPEITYGIGFSAGYKAFDFSVFFQGSARESFWINAAETAPFVGESQLLKAYADDHWSEDNRNIYALWPRLSMTQMNNNIQRSTWFMRNSSFLRLKQMELGYNVPKSFQRKLHTSVLRLYLNATNLFVLSSFKLWDVEQGGNGLGYPLQRVINIGLNITFN